MYICIPLARTPCINKEIHQRIALSLFPTYCYLHAPLYQLILAKSKAVSALRSRSHACDKEIWRHGGTLRLKCDGTRAETRFRLSAKRTSPFKSAGAPVKSTTGSRGMRISGSNAGYTMFRDSVKGTGYTLHSPVSPSFPLPGVTVCHHISTGIYSSNY